MSEENKKSQFFKKLAKIQRELKAPKNQYNSFGRYKYRSCEDILEAVKPLLGDLVLVLKDEVVNVGERYYIKASALLLDGENFVENSAFARESVTKKGMDDAQVTGSTSSYARKYALNGLFLIDDQKDSDFSNQGKEDLVASDEKKDYVARATVKQVEMIKGLIKDKFIDREFVTQVLGGKEVEKFTELSSKEASDLITEALVIKNQTMGRK